MGASGLGGLLVKEGLLSARDKVTIAKTCGQGAHAFAKTVIAMGLLDEDELASFLAARTQFAVAPKNMLEDMEIDALEKMDSSLLTMLEVIPLRIHHNTLVVAMADPLDRDVIRQLEFFTGYRVKPLIAPFSKIREGLSKVLESYQPSYTHFEQFLSNHAISALRKLQNDGRLPRPANRKTKAARPSIDATVSDDDRSHLDNLSSEAIDDSEKSLQQASSDDDLPLDDVTIAQGDDELLTHSPEEESAIAAAVTAESDEAVDRMEADVNQFLGDASITGPASSDDLLSAGDAAVKSVNHSLNTIPDDIDHESGGAHDELLEAVTPPVLATPTESQDNDSVGLDALETSDADGLADHGEGGDALATLDDNDLLEDNADSQHGIETESDANADNLLAQTVMESADDKTTAGSGDTMVDASLMDTMIDAGITETTSDNPDTTDPLMAETNASLDSVVASSDHLDEPVLEAPQDSDLLDLSSFETQNDHTAAPDDTMHATEISATEHQVATATDALTTDDRSDAAAPMAALNQAFVRLSLASSWDSVVAVTTDALRDSFAAGQVWDVSQGSPQALAQWGQDLMEQGLANDALAALQQESPKQLRALAIHKQQPPADAELVYAGCLLESDGAGKRLAFFGLCPRRLVDNGDFQEMFQQFARTVTRQHAA